MDGGRRQSDDQGTAGNTATTHPQTGRNMSGGAAAGIRVASRGASPVKERAAVGTRRQGEGVGGGWWGRYLCESSGACRWVRSLGVTLDSTAGQLEVTVSRCQQGELRVGQLRVYDRKWGNTPS